MSADEVNINNKDFYIDSNNEISTNNVEYTFFCSSSNSSSFTGKVIFTSANNLTLFLKRTTPDGYNLPETAFPTTSTSVRVWKIMSNHSSKGSKKMTVSFYGIFTMNPAMELQENIFPRMTYCVDLFPCRC